MLIFIAMATALGCDTKLPPSHVALFLDFSGSIFFDPKADSWNATLDFAQKFANEINPTDAKPTQIQLTKFNGTLDKFLPFTNDTQKIAEAINNQRSLESTGATNILECFVVFEEWAKNVVVPDGFSDPVLVLVTDGQHDVENANKRRHVTQPDGTIVITGPPAGPTDDKIRNLSAVSGRIRKQNHTIVIVLVGNDTTSKESALNWTGRSDTVFKLGNHSGLLNITSDIVSLSCGFPLLAVVGGIGLILLIIGLVVLCLCCCTTSAVIAKKKWNEEEEGTLQQTYAVDQFQAKRPPTGRGYE